MKRVNRYTVLKNSDLTILTTQQHNFLDDILGAVLHHRQNTGQKPLECVVVESSWPEYEPTWQAIESRVDRKLHQISVEERNEINTSCKGSIEELTVKYNKYFNLHHTLAVQEAGHKGILCDALGIEHYQHELHELTLMVTARITELEKRYSELLMVNSKYTAIKAELEEQGVHLLSNDCWCEPVIDDSAKL